MSQAVAVEDLEIADKVVNFAVSSAMCIYMYIHVNS